MKIKDRFLRFSNTRFSWITHCDPSCSCSLFARSPRLPWPLTGFARSVPVSRSFDRIAVVHNPDRTRPALVKQDGRVAGLIVALIDRLASPEYEHMVLAT